MKLLPTIILVLICTAILNGIVIIFSHKITCKDFANQREALSHYTKPLDADGDNKPCENLPK